MSLEISENEHCQNCQTPFQGAYCWNCGEKKMEKKELTLRHFFAKVWNAITFSDAKLLQSINLLLFSPGLLTLEFFSGRQKRYTKPLALFFAINLLYFVYQPVDAINSSLASQTSGQKYSAWAKEVLVKKMAEMNASVEEIEILYNTTSEEVSKLFLFVLVLIFAIGVFLVNIRQKQFFYVHLIAATHYVSFTILSLLLVIPLLTIKSLYLYSYFMEGQSIPFNPNALYVTLPYLIILLLYAYGMQRRMYRQGILISLSKAVLLVIAFAFSILLYRLFLFVASMALI